MIWRSAIAALAGILVWVLGCSAGAQTAAKPKENPEPFAVPVGSPANAALAAHEEELRRELQLHPESAAVLYELGLVLRQENKPKESLETYTQAAKYLKPDAEQLRSVALDYVLLDDYFDAIHWLERAVSLDAGDAEAWYSLGRCLYTQGAFHKAEDAYSRVLQIKPDHWKAEENLGLAYDQDNQPEKAEAALRTAAEWARKQPSDEWPYLNLGAFLLDHGRAVEAVPFLEKSTTIAPKSAMCHEKLGRALEESGRVPDGVKELETAVQLDPKNPNVHFELGHAYRQSGAIGKARAEFAVSQELRHERDHK